MADFDEGSRDGRIQVLLEEYRALYSLLSFRLSAMEQRIPTVAALLSGTLGGSTMLPEPARPLVFIGLPLALIWYVRSTLAHARSKQDVKLRIDEIEQQVNRLMGAQLLTFQSHHPSRGRVVAGRSGRELLMFVYFSVLALLVGCVYLYPLVGLPSRTADFYTLYATICALWISLEVLWLGRYRRS